MIGYLRTRVYVSWTTATNDAVIQHTVQTDRLAHKYSILYWKNMKKASRTS